MNNDQILATAIACVAVFVLWYAIEAYRRSHPPKPKQYGFISCYIAPLRDEDDVEYLYKCGDGEGWCYTRQITIAHIFRTHAEADKVTPKYDGSNGIAQRAFVKQVEIYL